MKKLFSIVLVFCLAIGSKGQNSLFATSNEVTAKLVILPPYPLDFRGLLDQPGNQIILHNLSNNARQVSLNFSLNATDGSVSIIGKKPVLSISISPRGTVSIPLSEFGVIISPNLLTCTGVSFNDVATNKVLPDGYYSICVSPMEFSTNKQLGNEACSNVFPIMALEPPMLRLTNAMSEDTVLNVNPQNLLFQWNLAASHGIRAMSSVRTILKVIEVPKGMTPNQAILSTASSNQIPQFSVENGRANFVYGPTLSPLVKGRRYAAVVQMTDPTGKVAFRNNGTSEVLTFVFGRPEFNPLESLLTRVNGSVKWAYKSIEETKEMGKTPLVSTNPINEFNNKVLRDNKPGKNVFPLKDAVINVFGSDTKPSGDGFYVGVKKVAIATGKSNELGNYNLELVLKQAMRKFKYVTFEVSHPSRLFSKSVCTYNYDSIINGLEVPTTVLVGQTIEFTPRVLLKDGEINDKVSINILMPEKEWTKYALLSDAGLGSTHKTILYNNQTYALVASINNGNTYKKLFQTVNENEHYTVQVNYPERQGEYYPMNGVFIESWDGLSQKPIVEIAKNYVYDNTITISGKIIFEGKARSNVRMTAYVDPADIIGNDKTLRTFKTISDFEGNYAIEGIPNLKKGAIIHFSIIEGLVSHSPIDEQITIVKSGEIKKDFTIIHKNLSVEGTLLDISHNPIANALVTVNNSNKIAYTNDQGKYSIQLDDNERNGELVFTADGFNDSIISIQMNVPKHQLKKLKNDVNAVEIIQRGFTTLLVMPKEPILINLLNTIDNSIIKQGTLSLVPQSGNGTIINVDITEKDVEGISIQQSKFTDPIGYTATFTPIKEQSKLLAIARFNVSTQSLNTAKIVTFGVAPSYALKGIVKDFNDTRIIQQLVTIKTTSGGTTTTQTAYSDKSGNFQLYVSTSSNIQITVIRPQRLAFDSVFNTLNDTIKLKNTVSQQFNTLLGFPVNVTSLAAISPSTNPASYSISGSINVGNNNVFNLSTNNIYFTNLVVTASGTNAIPTSSSINLAGNANLKMVAFGFATITQTNLTLTKVGSDGGKICAKMVLYPTSSAISSFILPNAILWDRIASADSNNTVIANSNSSILSNSNYSLFFSKGAYSSIVLPSNLNSTLNVDTAMLSSSGLTNLHGFIQLGSAQAVVANQYGKVYFKGVSMGTTYTLNSLSVGNGTDTIIGVHLQKVIAGFSKVMLIGLASKNPSIAFQGNLYTINNDYHPLPFTNMGLVQTNGLFSYSSSLSINSYFGLTSVDVKNQLIFKPQTGQSQLSLSYSGGTYNITGSIKLTASLNTTNALAALVTSNLTDFNATLTLQTYNWGVFIENYQAHTESLGVCNLSVGSSSILLVNVGSSASLTSMQSIMKGLQKKQNTSPITQDVSMINVANADANSYWSLGYSGTVSFPSFKYMNGTGKAAGAGVVITLAHGATEEVSVDSIYASVQTPIFSFSTYLVMIASAEKSGFSAEVALTLEGTKPGKKGVTTLPGTTLQQDTKLKVLVDFYFYKYTSTADIAIGAALTYATNTNKKYTSDGYFKDKDGTPLGILVGPAKITIDQFGFDVDTKKQVYKGFIGGTLTATAIDKSLLKADVKLEVLVAGRCSYLPIITGKCVPIVGAVFSLDTSKIDINLCDGYAYIHAHLSTSKLPSPLNKINTTADALLYIAVPKTTAPGTNGMGCFYVEADMDVSIPYILPNASAGFGVGYNVSTSNTTIPAASMTKLASYVGSGTMNGMYAYANKETTSSGAYGFDVLGIVYADFKYDQYLKYGFSFYADVVTPTLNLSVNFKDHTSGKVHAGLLGLDVDLGGVFDCKFDASADFSPSGFDIKGSGAARAEIYGGLNSPVDPSTIGCNDYEVDYWGGFIPDGIGGKVCLGVSLSGEIKSGKSPSITASFSTD